MRNETQAASVTPKSDPGAPGRNPKSEALEPRELLEIASGVRIRQITPFGNMHVQITVDPESERELEVFAQLGKGGDLANSDLEAICRMISLWLRSGGSLIHVIQQLKGIGSSLQVSTKEGKIMSLGDGIARSLEKYQRVKESIGLTNVLLGRFEALKEGSGLSPRRLCDGVPASPQASRRGDTADLRQGSGNGIGRNNGNGHDEKLRSATIPAEESADLSLMRHGESAVEPLASDRDASGYLSTGNEFKVVCPECKAMLYFIEGCKKCMACGWAQC